MIPTILLLLSFPRHVINSPYINTPLLHSSGIFYNKKGTASTSNDNLILLAHINTTQLEWENNILNSYFAKTRNLCTTTLKDNSEQNHVSFHCDQTIKLIEDELQSISRNREILHDLVGISKERKRRGLVNGASNILNWLIGTPDADDAQYYSDSIKMLVYDNKQTQTLLKSQVQIISSTIKNFNSSLQSLKTTENTLNNNLRLINKYMSQTNGHLTRLALETTITQHVTMLLSLCMRISDDYNKYIEAINLGNHNIISTFIVTPGQLCEELNDYRGNFELPLAAETRNLPILYKLMKLRLIFDNGLVVFTIRFPLVKKTYFDVYELIPLPTQHKNSSIFSYITPKQPYLLISQSKTHFSYLPNLSNCNEYSVGLYICTDVHTTKATNDATCEVSLLSPHINQLPSDCETRTIRAEIETWKYIGENQWIYILQKPITLTIMCENKKDHMEDILLQQTGILQLQSNCRGYTLSYLLETTSHTNKNFTHYVPPISIIGSDCCITSEILKLQTTSLEPIKLTNINLNDLKYANKKIEDLDDLLTHRLKEPFIVSHTQWYTITLFVIIAIILFFICGNCCHFFGCWRFLKRLLCFTKNPTSGDVVPPLIKNFVNCTFDSEIRAEYREQSKDIILHDTKDGARVHRTTVPEEEEVQQSLPTSTASPRYHLRSNSDRTARTRKSTRPL